MIKCKRIISITMLLAIMATNFSTNVFAYCVPPNMLYQVTKYLEEIREIEPKGEIRDKIDEIILKLAPRNYNCAQVESTELQNDLNKLRMQIERDKPQYKAVLTRLDSLRANLRKEDYKEHILATYPRVPAALRKVKLDSPVGNGRSIEVSPDGHFVDPAGREILLCFGSKFGDLKDKLHGEYKHYSVEHNFLLWPIKYALDNNVSKDEPRRKEITCREYISIVNRCMLGFIAYAPVFLFAESKFKQVGDKAEFLTEKINHINQYLTGPEKDNAKHCIAVFRKDFSANGVCFGNNPDYSEIDNIIKKISGIKMDDGITNVRYLDKLLEYCLNEYAPETFSCEDHPDKIEISKAMCFCYPLTKIDLYLREIEKDRNRMSADTVFAMRRLREKVNYLSLRYKFPHLEECSPILDIHIEKHIPILEEEKGRIIFLEKDQAKKFYNSVGSALNRKATIINNRTNEDSEAVEPMPLKEIGSLVQQLDLKSLQDAIDELNAKINDKEAEKENVRIEGITICGNEVIKFAGKVVKFILQARGISAPVTEQDSKVKDTTVTEQDSKTKDTPVIEQDFKIEDVEKYLDSTNEEKNMTKIGKALECLELTPEETADIITGLKKFVECSKIGEKIKMLEKQKRYFEFIGDKETDIINLYDLYIQLSRLNLEQRTDYHGIYIEEIRNKIEEDGKGKEFREYIVTEMKELGDMPYYDV